MQDNSRTTTVVVARFLFLITPLTSLALSRRSLYVLRLPTPLSLSVLTLLLHLQLLVTPPKELPVALFSGTFLFRKPVPRALAEDYKRRQERGEIRRQAEASRNENERRMKHSVLLMAYLHNDNQPTMLPFQDIKSWPTLNLSQIASLAEQLGLPDPSDFSLFDPITRFGYQR